MVIGVLALQGDFANHISLLHRLNVITREVRLPKDLSGLKGLIIPGGESTTIGKLLVKYGLDRAIKSAYKKGLCLYGTCAGAIILAKEIIGSDQPRIGLCDISVKRNAYGRQIDSFEHPLSFKDSPINAVFIRAPQIVSCAKNVSVLLKCEGKPVLIEQQNILISTFHPELGSNTRIHEYFLEMCNGKNTTPRKR